MLKVTLSTVGNETEAKDFYFERSEGLRSTINAIIDAFEQNRANEIDKNKETLDRILSHSNYDNAEDLIAWLDEVGDEDKYRERIIEEYCRDELRYSDYDTVEELVEAFNEREEAIQEIYDICNRL